MKLSKMDEKQLKQVIRESKRELNKRKKKLKEQEDNNVYYIEKSLLEDFEEKPYREVQTALIKINRQLRSLANHETLARQKSAEGLNGLVGEALESISMDSDSIRELMGSLEELKEGYEEIISDGETDSSELPDIRFV